MTNIRGTKLTKFWVDYENFVQGFFVPKGMSICINVPTKTVSAMITWISNIVPRHIWELYLERKDIIHRPSVVKSDYPEIDMLHQGLWYWTITSHTISSPGFTIAFIVRQFTWDLLKSTCYLILSLWFPCLCLIQNTIYASARSRLNKPNTR